ncbi:MAG: PQQ-binding-like beta-propeller repeat protein [Oscillochloris sp.]|nr:PQQ-binding-like beta-propeller repeat protein [Oscillochloris sp.]
MATQHRGTNRGGCLFGLGFGMLVGLCVGISATLGLTGLDSQYLLDRVRGNAPALVAATAVPTPLSAISGASAGRRLVWDAAIPLDSDTREPELLLISRNHDRNSDTILRFSPDQRQVIWESAPIDENGSSWRVAYDDERVFVATELRLLALSRADGSLLWDAQLSDSIQTSICRDCLLALNGTIAAYSQDGVLQVFAGADGTPLWSRRMRVAARQLVRFDDLIGIPDSLPDESGAAALYLFEPEDGTPAGEIAPLCVRPDTGWEDRPHYFDQVMPGPDGMLYWYLDSARCLVRLAPGEREVTIWAGLPEDRYIDDEDFLFAAGALFIGGESEILAITADGTVRTILADEDYELTPISASNDVLLVEARRTRGSSRSELWLVDPVSGERRGAIPFQADTRVNADTSGDWAAAIVDGGVAVVETQEEPEQLYYRLLDPATSDLLMEKTLPTENATALIRGAVWTRESLFLSADELYTIALNDGTIRYRWP